MAAVAVRAPPDNKRTRPAASGAFGKVTLDVTPTRSIAEEAGGVVVDLDGYRARRLLADLGLAPTVSVPCGPCCRCYGTPLGQGCGS
jgi:hypothetical protein